jgi:hypothetical protein
MLRSLRSVRTISREIAEAAESGLAAYCEGRASEEHQITDRILGVIEDRLSARKIGGVSWRARTLRTSRGTALPKNAGTEPTFWVCST